MFERMLDKSINPQYSDLVGFCGTQGEMFDRFNDWVRTNFETDAEIKFPYGNSYGWCVSHHKKSKLICNVFPEKDAFCVMVRKTNKQFSEVYDKVSEQAKEVIDNKYPCNDGGWIHFRVTDEASYADIVKIMEADLFPRTHKVQTLKQMSPILAVDLFPRTRQKSDINLGLSNHVETVVLLGKRMDGPKDYVKIGLDVENYYKIKDAQNKQGFE